MRKSTNAHRGRSPAVASAAANANHHHTTNTAASSGGGKHSAGRRRNLVLAVISVIVIGGLLFLMSQLVLNEDRGMLNNINGGSGVGGGDLAAQRLRDQQRRAAERRHQSENQKRSDDDVDISLNDGGAAHHQIDADAVADFNNNANDDGAPPQHEKEGGAAAGAADSDNNNKNNNRNADNDAAAANNNAAATADIVSINSDVNAEPIAHLKEPLYPGQCPNDPDLNDPLVRAIEVPKTNKEYLKIRKGGFGYPDFMFQCRERRFGNYIHFMTELTNDVDNTILEPSGRYHWCPKAAEGQQGDKEDGDVMDAEIEAHLNPLNTPAIPTLVEGVPTPNTFADATPETIALAAKDRSFETLVPLLKMSLRRTAYLTPLLKLQRRSIEMPTPDTSQMWSPRQPMDESALGSSLLLKLWNERFGSDAPGTDVAALGHEERLKRVIVVTTWLLNRPSELNKHILRMVEKEEKKKVSDLTLDEFWEKLQRFQLGALNITGRYRDETFFNNQIATKHCQIDSHDNEQSSPDGRAFRAHRMENIMNIRHAGGVSWDFCDLLTVDTFLRLTGLSIASTQDIESLFVFNVRGALGTRGEKNLETVAGLPNAKVPSTLVKVMPGAVAEDFDPKTVADEDTCVVDGTTATLGSFGISTAINARGTGPAVPTLCRLRHLARAFRKFHRLTLRMGAVAATDRAAAHGLSKLLKEEGIVVPKSASPDPKAAASCSRRDTIAAEWLFSLRRMDKTLKNIIPELQLDGVYAADAAERARKIANKIPDSSVPLMLNPMTDLWTQKIDDSFVPIWTLTLWEIQQYELMTAPFAANGLLHMDRRYRADSLTFNAHPFTVAMKKKSLVNAKLHERFGDALTVAKPKDGQRMLPFASQQFVHAPRPDRALEGKLHNKEAAPFGIDYEQRTALAKLQHMRYGFIDLDEIAEATAKMIEAKNDPEAFVNSDSYLTPSNALSTLARMLSFYTSIPFSLSEEESAKPLRGCEPFVFRSAGDAAAANNNIQTYEIITQCPSHPIYTEGLLDAPNVVYVLHRHPLGTYTTRADVKISLGSVNIGGKRTSLGSILGVAHTPAPQGMVVNNEAGARIPAEVLGSVHYAQISAEGTQMLRMPMQVGANTAMKPHHVGDELSKVLAEITTSVAQQQQQQQQKKEKDGGKDAADADAAEHHHPSVSAKQFKAMRQALRKRTWDFGLRFHEDVRGKMNHGQVMGLTERWPSYFAMVPLRWDTVFVPRNAILQLSSAPIYTAGAVIRRPMLWVGSEANSLLARCVASNEPNCGSNFVNARAARDAFIEKGVPMMMGGSGGEAAAPVSASSSTLRVLPSFDLAGKPTLISLTDAFYQRFPMTIVNDMLWMSLNTGLYHMKAGLRRRRIPTDGDLQPPFSSCIGLRDAHPFVQYALSNAYGEATINAVSEDHYGGLVFAQPKASRPMQAPLSPAFFGINGDDEGFEPADVAARHTAFSKVREAMFKGVNAW